ncbi:hypothetical protein LR48_Vigan06g035300 [Vigna angularis]|uniref:Uncharacterized protein n=1 Tax=Phaseolus angularis TaxID=3914 RepID=A0A0L9UR45_PHAAN|nr:hypothetical protein LR48_Vigan06g035300 [Vigna angularis]
MVERPYKAVRENSTIQVPLPAARLPLLTSTQMIIAMTKTNVQNKTRQETQALNNSPKLNQTENQQWLRRDEIMQPELGLHVPENERLKTMRTYQFRTRNRSVQTEALDAGSASTVPER